MKAVIHTKYGPPEVAKLMETQKPIPKENELLIEVYASTVNRTDCGFRSAEYFVSRFFSGLFSPKCQTLGCEFAGVVVEIGKNTSQFKVGDRVFGFDDSTFGGHAEFLTINENKAIALMPDNLDFFEAAPIAEGAHYALNIIRAAKLKKGDKVLINGATGAIGSAGLQLLKYFEMNVTAVCNTKNLDLIKSLGADKVIDYQKEDFTKITTKFNFIFDAVGKSSFGSCKPLLEDNGIYISTELGKNAENVFLALFTPLFSKKKVLFPIPTITKDDLIFLRELVEKGLFMPVIDRFYTLEQIVEAYKYAESSQKTGNLVLKIKD